MQTANFSLTQAVHGEARVLVARGELDIATTATLAVAGRETLRAGARRLCVDLTDVQFMDSGGLAALLALLRSADRTGARLTVACPDGQPRRVIETTRMLEALGVTDTLTAALAALDGGQIQR